MKKIFLIIAFLLIPTIANSGTTIGGGSASLDTNANQYADVADTVVVADTNETKVYIALFTAATGNLALKTDAALYYNASTGVLTATGFSGAWSGSVITPAYGGTGVANNASSTLTVSGAYGLTFTLTAARDLTIPISGTAVVTTEAISANHLIVKAPSGEGYVDGGAPIEATDGITFHFDGGGSEIADNKIACTTAKFAMDITAWTIIPDQSGSIKIDIWKDTYANGLPTNANTITNGHEPEVSSAAKAQDTDLSDWTTLAVAAGDIVCASVDSATTITWANLVLTGTRK